VYDRFLESYYQDSNPISEINQFKLYVKYEMETRLNNFPNLGYDGNEEQQINVAVITCAFDNKKVIKWLQQRGTHIKNEKWDKVDKVEKTIDDALKKDKQLLDKLQRPCSAFITMETEEGYYRLENYNDTVEMAQYKEKYGTFLGHEIEVRSASEPTDIIWENRGYSEFTRNWKKVVTALIILFLLSVSFTVIFFC